MAFFSDPYSPFEIFNSLLHYSTAQMQHRSRSHYFASGEYTRVIFDAQVILCYSRALEMTNSRVIFPWDNRSLRSRRAKVQVWTLERVSETQSTRELWALETHPLESFLLEYVTALLEYFDLGFQTLAKSILAMTHSPKGFFKPLDTF